MMMILPVVVVWEKEEEEEEKDTPSCTSPTSRNVGVLRQDSSSRYLIFVVLEGEFSSELKKDRTHSPACVLACVSFTFEAPAQGAPQAELEKDS